MKHMQVADRGTCPGAPHRRPLAVALLAVALTVTVTPGLFAAPASAAPTKASRLKHQLTQTLHQLSGTRQTLAQLTGRTDLALAALRRVSGRLAQVSALAVAREREAVAAIAAVDAARIELRRLRAVAAWRARQVRVVLQSDQVAGADPLGALAPLLQGSSLSQAVSQQTEIGLVGSANAQKLAAAGRAVLAARAAARRLARLAAQARRLANEAASLRAQVASQRQSETGLVATLTQDRARTAAVVASLEVHASGLQQAIAALLAAARSGKVSEGTLMALVAAVAAAFHVDPALVWAVVMVESGGNPNATSSTGAQGLMQLEPATAAALGVRNAYNAKDNLMGGAHYLAGLVRLYHGNLALAIAAYNMGPGAVAPGGQVPPAARAYVQSVLSYWQTGHKKFAGGRA